MSRCRRPHTEENNIEKIVKELQRLFSQVTKQNFYNYIIQLTCNNDHYSEGLRLQHEP